MAEHDLAPLRETITAIVRTLGFQGPPLPRRHDPDGRGKGRWIIDKLPADILKRVVWRENFWLTDEALSTYVRSAGLFGIEMHSPIMCVGNGVPAIVGRFEEQTSKGFMWRDIGLGEWLFDLDRPADRGDDAVAVGGAVQVEQPFAQADVPPHITLAGLFLATGRRSPGRRCPPP